MSCRVLFSTSHACLSLLFFQQHLQTKRVFFIKDLEFHFIWSFKRRPPYNRHYWYGVEFCITQHLNVYFNRYSSYLYFASLKSILVCDKTARFPTSHMNQYLTLKNGSVLQFYGNKKLFAHTIDFWGYFATTKRRNETHLKLF